MKNGQPKPIEINEHYREMVEKAEELQDLRKKKVPFSKKYKWKFETGDIFIAYRNRQEKVEDNLIKVIKEFDKIYVYDPQFWNISNPDLLYWCPRLDQLLDALPNYEFVRQNMNEYAIKCNFNKEENIEFGEPNERESVVLKMVMKYFFKKKWDTERKEWL